MQILFVHPNFPAQFGPVLSRLQQRPDLDCVFATTKGRGVDNALVGRLNWNQYKRRTVSELVDELLARGDEGLPTLTKLCRDVASMDAFPHLARLEDGDRKVQDAENAVAELRRLVRTNRMVDEEVAEKKRREERAAAQEETDAFQRRLREIATLFAQVSSNAENPQQRGRDLEKVMCDLFDLFELDPRSSFSLSGEQIDGTP